MKNRGMGFTMKMLLFTVVLIVISATVSTLIAYFYSRYELQVNLATQLLGIVNSAVVLIDADKHENIYLTPEGKIEGKKEFEDMRKKLVAVKENTGLKGHKNSSPIYTMRKAYDFEKSKQLEFVVMTDKNEKGQYFVGARIKAEPHHLKALAGKAATTKIYKDVEGFWISAAAPIKDSNGNVMAILQADFPIQFYQKKLYTLARELFFGALVSVFIALLLAVIFSRRLVKPIKKLVFAAELYGAGDLSHKVEVKRSDEVGVLAKSFNVMAEKIRKNRENLERLVEERTADLRAMKERAESASRAKSSFLANMSHELRTPLNAVIGLSEMLLEDAKDANDEIYIEPLVRINGAGKHLLQLINEILDLSKIEAGKIELLIEEHSFENIMEDIKILTTPLAQKNNNKLVITYDDVIDKVKTDVTRFKQVLINLLGNACKFTENGTVKLEVSQEKENGELWLKCAVSDTGIGMTSEQMEKVFEKFSQADIRTTSKFGGTGLGLSISRKICQLMGGDISVKSEFGKGSIFTAMVPAHVKKQAEEDKSGVKELIPGYKKEERKKTAKSTKVLVIEDDEITRELMERYLEKEGYEVLTAVDGEMGLKIAKNLKPGAIILDIILPDMSGWNILSEIKHDPLLRDTLVIVVSALDEKNKGFALGATDYLVKPITRTSLIETLNKYRKDKKEMKVLVVDDDESARIFMRKILEKEGLQVFTAENGKVALSSLVKDAPELILLDLMMPVMDGFEFLEEMRKTKHWAAIPVIIVTAKTLTKEDHERLNSRVIQILHKGQYDATNLREAVLKVLSRYIKPTKEKPHSKKEK